MDRRDQPNVYVLPPLNTPCSVGGCAELAVTEIRFRDFDRPAAVDEALQRNEELDLFVCAEHYRGVMARAISLMSEEDTSRTAETGEDSRGTRE